MRLASGFSLALLVASFAAAQNPPLSDPQALALAAKSVAALTGGTAISDVSLTGNATRIAGSDSETGTATFLAKGTSESRVDLALSGGKRTDIRNSSGGFPQGAWVSTDGVSNSYALHNCWTDANWFFPVLSSLSASDRSIVLSYVGLESRSGASVQHLRSFRYLPSKIASSIALTEQLSTMDFYLDASSLLPVAVTFNVHPDDDASLNIPVEIDFSTYQLTEGLQVPLHIQKYLQGGLVLDFAVTGVLLNSGLPDSNFSIQ